MKSIKEDAPVNSAQGISSLSTDNITTIKKKNLRDIIRRKK
jgi:hypothetical protein